jgi:acetyl-CoA acyltransferase
MREALILDAVRTPTAKGRAGGKLSRVHPVDLLAHTLRALRDRVADDTLSPDDVIAGCVSQVGQQSRNIARNAVLAAGFPDVVPATTIDRMCGSSQQASQFAAQAVMSGQQELVIACGVESMSQVPMRSAEAGQDPYGQTLPNRYSDGLIRQGISAELIAARWRLSRRELDEFALRSHQLAHRATLDGGFREEIAPIKAPQATRPAAGPLEADGLDLVATDEGIRPNTSLEALAALPAAFLGDPDAQRFPEIAWRVTAGNSSQISDGAAALLIGSRGAADALGLRPRARFHSFSVVGSDPILMLMGVLPATERALAKAGLTISDIDFVEINEAFASVVLAWQQETGCDWNKINAHGGAIALGHPLGASGARLSTSLLSILEQRNATFGLQVMCEAGGMANATIIERL